MREPSENWRLIEQSVNRVTEAELRGLIERADSVKMQRARERLEAVRAESIKAVAETQPEES